jgi:(1->4)-alpha-D-glucan 1-alpha-D-glucosylmutase
MIVPLSTYRIQFGPHFGFRKAREIVPYLYDLGISHLYASPIFKARKSSAHGYDGVDPNQLNPELGTAAEFEELVRALRNHHMGWLQDIVPNHMAYDGDNPWLADVFENGSASKSYRFFDIDWNHSHPDLKGKVIAPFLGRPGAQCFENQEVRLVYGPEGFSMIYYDLKLPLKADTYGLLLSLVHANLAARRREQQTDAAPLKPLIAAFENLPVYPRREERRRQIQAAKTALWRLSQQSPAIQQSMADTLAALGNEKDNPRCRGFRDTLWSRQVFALAFWKTAARQINYRRFFAVNDLIALRQERAAVFNQTHALILKLVRQGWFTGLRVDHIDGLADPADYLERLRKKTKAIYLVVEKILSAGERLPTGWPVQGTTGYDFADRLCGLFCQGAQAERFDALYRHWSDDAPAYEDQVFQSKRQFLEQEMAGDMDNLARLFQKAAAGVLPGRAASMDRLRPALTAFLAALPVYRTYSGRQGPDKQQSRHVRQAAEVALARSPILRKQIRFIRELLLKPPGTGSDPCRQNHRAYPRQAVQRLQQLAAAAAAKGVEDTALYRYHRLISLNDVGGHPGRFGCPLERFHDFITRRCRHWLHSMNGSSTHDAKRSEDVRARINVLSEMPEKWRRQVQSWCSLNREHKVRLDGRRVPHPPVEYFIYQTLVGACPLDPDHLPGFTERAAACIVKAAREAKQQTSWIDPQPAYEGALSTFVRRILAPLPENSFLKEFWPFLQEIAHYGAFNALSQTLIKITAPGVPDFYRGTELLRFSLVDPDNRRPVDFTVRRQWLAKIRARHKSEPLALIADLLENKLNGQIKLFLIYAALQTRRQHADLFQKGRYMPLTAAGRRADHVVAFARRCAGAWSLTLVPRFVSGLVAPHADPLGGAVWGDTACRLPPHAPAFWTDTFTSGGIESRGWLKVGDAFRYFPAALLIGGTLP